MRATFPLSSLYVPFVSLRFSRAHEYLSSEECATTSLLSFPRLVLYTQHDHDRAPATLGDAALSIASPSVDIAPLGWPCRGQAIHATFPLSSFYVPFLSLRFSRAHEYLSSEECAATSLLSFPRLVSYTHNTNHDHAPALGDAALFIFRLISHHGWPCRGLVGPHSAGVRATATWQQRPHCRVPVIRTHFYVTEDT
jgi:hypothetical protein